MTLGFTGTSHGMTQRQRSTVRYLFSELQLTGLHHGDCVGADAQAHADALEIKARVIIYPPTDEKLRAFCSGAGIVHLPRPYLIRNRMIVAMGVDGVIACPKDFIEPTNKRGQGTWTTIGYARQAGRRLWIVYPDGTWKEEAAK